jgi:predicted enzyme related to lactoylglutathione lyase
MPLPIIRSDAMNPFQTPGAVSWTELTTPDPAAAQAFYGALFGWRFDAMPMPDGTYHVIKVTDDAAIGGIMATPPQAQGTPPMWGSYVTVADCDATAAKCTSLGGKVCVGPMDIPNVGRFAMLQDPQGAMLYVIAYKPSMK